MACALQCVRAVVRQSRGFSLIEVLVATAILVTVAAGTAQLFAIAIRSDAITLQQLAMTTVATAKIDELAALTARGAPPLSPMGALDRAVDGFSDVAISAGASFERRWVVAPLPGYSATAVVIVLRVVPRAALNAGGLEVATIADAGGP